MSLEGAKYLNQAPATGGQANNGNGGGDGKVRASHLLIKHSESRRPSSWKEVSRLEISNLDSEIGGLKEWLGREVGEFVLLSPFLFDGGDGS